MASQITNTIVYMLAVDNMVLSSVEKRGFTKLMKLLAPRYPIPSRKTVTSLMEKKYAYLSNLVKEDLLKVRNVSITTDIWTDKHMRSYLGITVHYHINSLQKNIILGIQELQEKHTSKNIENELRKITEEWNIRKENIITVVSLRNGIEALILYYFV